MSDHRAATTRRAFLRRTAVAAGIPAAVVAGIEIDKYVARPAKRAKTPGRDVGYHRPKVPENSLPGTPHWWIQHIGAPDAIIGYADRASVRPGDQVHLYVSTTSREFSAVALRMGWYHGDLARQVWRSPAVRGHRQRHPQLTTATNTVHCDWGESLTVDTHGWPPGSYLFRLDSQHGQRYIPLTVRSTDNRGRVVIKNAVETWQAYNTWGGYDLYHGPAGASDYANRSFAVSLDRPYDEEGAYLFMVYERRLVNLAEQLGLNLGYLTSMDIASDPHALDGASALVSPGHDEYWTPAERAHVTQARDQGMNIAFLGANAMYRRTRLAGTSLGPGRLTICYKTSWRQDPMWPKHPKLVTSNWRDQPYPDPESSLIGTLYEGYPAVADYVVRTPGAWMFKGTGAREGTRFRALVGIEYDRVTPGYPINRPIQIVAHSPLVCQGVASFSDSAYYTHRGGAGVFNTGTMRWVEAFAGQDRWGITNAAGAFTRRVTTNVLRAFASGPAAHKYPAHDNLTAMHEHYGDPIASSR